MRRVILAAAACAFWAGPLFADTAYLTHKYAYFSGNGGEFTVKPQDWDFDPVQLYADTSRNVAGTTGTFQSFCIEKNEEVLLQSTCDVILSDQAVLGGGGAVGGTDPISRGTAYLYYEFAQGTLSGYNYTPGGDRKASAGQLQDTIWWLEDEIAMPANVFTTLVLGRFGDEAIATSDNAGLYPVLAMNMYTLGHAGESGYETQDMLTVVPLPAAVLLGVLGLGAAGLRLRKFE